MRLRVGLCFVLTALSACSCEDKPSTLDAGPALPIVATRALPPEAAADPVAAAKALVPPRKGACAQVRSIPDEAKANQIAEAIRKAHNLPVELLRADLGDKGVWFRVCVGDEQSAARLVAKASGWTAPGGELEPFLDEPQDGTPRYFVKEREDAEPRSASAAASRAILETALVAGAPLTLAGGPTQEALSIAGTAYEQGGEVKGGLPPRTLAVVAGPDGTRAVLGGVRVPGCAACEVLLTQQRTDARVLSAGDLWPTPGDELLIEESSKAGDKILSVAVASGGRIERVAGVLLARATPGVLLSGTAQIVDADLDSQREIVVRTTELRLQGDDGCVLESHAALYDAAASGLSRIEVQRLELAPPSVPAQGDAADGGLVATPPDEGGSAVATVVALDAAGDHALASRVCASLTSQARPGAATRYCLERVRTLLAEGNALQATNAGGLLSAAAPPLRALLAPSFFAAASVLDADPRLQAAPPDCATAPLVSKVSTRGVEENLKLAGARAKERLSLGDVMDPVFVTAIRDFGADTPVGAIAAKWLDRMQLVLPGRHAAIEALLLPPAAPAPDAGPAPLDATPGFGGAP
jgi:hypothetical protein